MKYQHVLSISLKDGVVTQEDFVWVHWVGDHPEQHKAGQFWHEMVEDPSWFSVEKPEYTINKNYETVYKV